MSTESLKELEAQRAELEQRIEKVRKTERNNKIKEIIHEMALFNISFEDLTAALQKKNKPKIKRETVAKYRNPETSETWSGLGNKPIWVKTILAEGKNLDDFLIKKPK